MAGKRISFASMAGAPVADVPGREAPNKASLVHIAPNPDNPRDHDDLELDELMASLREVGQLQPVLVMSRASFCRLRPERESDVPSVARWVVIGGNRRLEAARALGWTSLDIKVRDDLGDGAGAIDEAIMVENIGPAGLSIRRSRCS
jgi:ParB family chromosome partitioning protein